MASDSVLLSLSSKLGWAYNNYKLHYKMDGKNSAPSESSNTTDRHPLVEIRIGALDSLLDRLDRCLLGVHDLIQSKDLLEELLKWFEREPCPRKADVLKLILLILKADTYGTLIYQIGLDNVFSNLEAMQPKLPTEILPLLFEIMDVVQLQEANCLELSESIISTETKQCVLHREIFPVFLFPWQHLLLSDRHVILAVHESLNSNKEPSQVVHTSQFFIDVMLRDFPPEIFLQRPSVVMVLLRLCEHEDMQISERAICCLNSFASALLVRIQCFYQPEFDNLKLVTRFDISCDSDRSLVKRSEGRALNQSHDQSYSAADLSDAYLYNASQAGSDANSGHSESQMKQWSVPQFCTISLLQVLPLVDSHPRVDQLVAKLVRLLTQCVTSEIWAAPATNPLATYMAVQIQDVFKLMGACLLQQRVGERNRLLHLQLLSVTRELLPLVPLRTADRCVPRTLKDALVISIMDPCVRILYPRLHQDILLYVQLFRGTQDDENLRIYRKTVAVTDSMTSAVLILKSKDNITASEFIKMAEQALLSLPIHRDPRFAPLIINRCSKYYSRWRLDQPESKALTSILLKLLANMDSEIKRLTYKHFHKVTISTVGVNPSIRNSSESLTFFIYNPAILTEIVTYGVGNSDLKIRDYAEDIILHLLKAHLHFETSTWAKFLESLTPVLPLLQCWATQTSPLGRAITSMLDPDVGEQIKLPAVELLAGNLRLLFAKYDHRRTEAISRLIWLLRKQLDPHNKLLDFATLQELIPGTLCILGNVPDKFAPLPEQPYYQEGSVMGAVELIQCGDPELRQSALIQLNVMLEDPRLHNIFLGMDGLATLLDILDLGLRQERIDEFLSWVSKVVNILRSLSFHHSKTRHRLAQDAAFMYDILRVLFLSNCDNQLRVAVVQLTASLLYSDVACPLSPKTIMAPSFSLPFLIQEKMLLPFSCPSHGRTSHFEEPLLSDELLPLESCRSFFRVYWSVESAGSVDAFLKNSSSELGSSTLQIEEGEESLLRISSMVYSSERQLSLIESASSHQQVAACLDILTATHNLFQSLARWHKENPVSSEVLADTASMEKRFLDLDWKAALLRFLIAAPASLDDQYLLVKVMEFLQNHVKMLRSIELPENYQFWLTSLLQKPSNPLPSLLRTVSDAGDSPALPKWKDVYRELLVLISECVRLEGLQNQSLPKDRPNEWTSVIESMARSLRFSDTQHFYNLAYLDWHLSTLTDLTCTSGWHKEGVLDELLPCLLELVHTFHLECGKGGDSFMGLSITRSSVLCLNNLLNESFSSICVKEWDNCGPLLHSLWQSRDSLVRCAALQLVSGLVLSKDFFSVLSFDMCTCAVRILLDHDEASYVRQQAAILLFHLTSHDTKGQSGAAPHLGVLQDILAEGNFLSELWTIFERFSSSWTCRPRGSCGEAVGVVLLSNQSEETVVIRSDSDAGRVVPVTPSLINALSQFLTNCLSLDWGTYLGGPSPEFTLSLFRCLGPVPQPVERSLIEMYASICHVLTSCALSNKTCHAALLQLPDLIHSLLPLVDIVDDDFLQGSLWTEVFCLLTVLLSNHTDTYSPIHGALIPQNAEPLASSLVIALSGESKFTGKGTLKYSAIVCVIALLSHPACREGEPFQAILDQTRSDSENSPKESSFGAELCITLLGLYELHCYKTETILKLDKGNTDEVSTLVTKALSALLLVSFEAKKQALMHELPDVIHAQLFRELNVLSMQPVECLNRVSDRKKVCPPLRRAELLLDLANNFAFGEGRVKNSLANVGLADDIHKLWIWSLHVPSLLKSSLRFLTTATSDCLRGAHSLALTTTTPGLGLRRTPSSHSLLHSLVAIIHQEMVQLGRGHNFETLRLTFNVLINSCQSPECRVTLTKSSLTRDLKFLDGKHRDVRPVVSLWMEFLIQLTLYPEGQTTIAKVPDFIDFLVTLALGNSKMSLSTMQILRNMSFHQSNRIRLFASDGFLRLLHIKLLSENVEEKACALTSLWSLIANHQKGKLAARSARLDARLEEALRVARQDPKCSDHLLQLLTCVSRILCSESAMQS